MSIRTARNELITQTREAAEARHKLRLAALLAEMRRRLTGIVESFYDIGKALGEIVDKHLFRAVGHESFRDFLAAEKLMSPRQASKLIAIARRFERERALALGPERAYALLHYAKAANDDAALRDDATVAGRPALELPVREIMAAAQQARAHRGDKRQKSPAAQARQRADAALVRGVRAGLQGVGRVAVRVVDGRVRVEFTRAQAERIAAKV